MRIDDVVNEADLFDEREELLRLLLQEEEMSLPEAENLAAVRRQAELPLSYAQQRLWFLAQFEPSSIAYHVPVAVRMKGPLNIAALEQVLSEIVRRHESLRTTFEAVEGTPFQVINRYSPSILTLIDLSALALKEQTWHAHRLATDEAKRPFDLARGPLFKTRLFKLNREDHLPLLAMHHIVSDGWSRGVLIREVAALYEAFCAGYCSPFPDLPIQYADYASWQRQKLQGPFLDKLLGYWRQQLAGGVPSLQLPTDRPRHPGQTARGARQWLLIPPHLTESVKALTSREGLTLFMTLLSAFFALLYRYTKQEDLAVGSPIANRTRDEIEGLIGFFVNTLLLRVGVSSHLKFRQLLGRVRELSLNASEHQDLPLEKLLGELQPGRDLSGSPLFQVMFAMQNAPSSAFQLSKLSLAPISVDTGTTQFDLIFEVTEVSSELSCRVTYNADLFGEPSMARLLGHFQSLLEGVVANPETRLMDLPLLTPVESQQLLVEWNDPMACLPQDFGIHELFEWQAGEIPDFVAIVHEQEHLTYDELNREANRLAHYLQWLGVGPDRMVAICLEPSVRTVIALLGTLKAGGAYVPLDPAYPKERLAFILEDTSAVVLLTQQSLLSRLPETKVQAVCIDADRNRLNNHASENPEPNATADNLAYVIYTSGSTGRPKGVLIPHANVTHLFEATHPFFHFGREDVWTFFHSYAFDFSVWEIWGALIYGGRMVVVPYVVGRSPELFAELLQREQVTVLNQTPSAFHQFSLVDERAAITSESTLRWVIFGGEALDLHSLDGWFERHGDRRPELINMYGITETTVHVTFRRITTADLSLNTSSVIGNPIPNLRLYALDDSQHPTPIGVPGELFVGGAGLARGYLHRPELTAERFVPDGLSSLGGARLYKTGDLGRYLNDGDVEYLGRIDHQVKIRGFRIELGEIEAALTRNPAVRHCIVIVRENEAGEKQLICYAITAEVRPTISELRDFLRKTLPEYMVPSSFVFLDQFPLTSNGKVDRRALPLPDSSRPELEQPYVAPQTFVEELLAAIWSDVLGKHPVGIHDNFFALGGDSILSVKATGLAKERGLSISLQQLFQYQSISELSRVVSSAGPNSTTAIRLAPFDLVCEADRAKLPDDLEDAYPLASLQMGMLYHLEVSGESSIYHNVSSWQLRMPFDEALFHQAAQRVIARHEVLRTGFDLTNYEEPLQLVHKQAAVSVVIDDLRQLTTALQEEVIAKHLENEKKKRFDLSRPPLLRFHIHRRKDDELQFTLTECHAILDGWSLTSTLADIFSGYFALLNGRVLTDDQQPSFKYRDFVSLERTTVLSEESNRYWTEKLRDCRILKLPGRISENKLVESARVRKESLLIAHEVVEALRMLAQSARVPLKSVLLAAHLKVLSLVSGETDILTGLVSNGRPEEPDADNVRGLFLNTLPLRVNLQDGTWEDLVRAAFESEWETFPHRRYPLSLLQKRSGGNALFEVNFNYLHFHSYEPVLRPGQVTVLSSKELSETNFTLTTVFYLNPVSTAELGLYLHYDSSRLLDQQVKELIQYYERTLRAMAENPAANHHWHCYLLPHEQHKILFEWNKSDAVFNPEQRLQDLIENQERRTPEAIAVISADSHLTFRQLCGRANRLAHHLVGKGVGLEDRVGVLMKRNEGLLVVLLGILKAGAAYVPLDPEYPVERLNFMIADAGIKTLVTDDPASHSTLAAVDRVSVFDRQWGEIEGREDGPEIESGPDNLAYVIYTSGTTGKPKGVMIHHRGIVNYLISCTTAYQLAGGEGAPVYSSLAFDLTVTSLFAPLIMGQCVTLMPDNQTPETLDALARSRNHFSFVKLTPSHLEIINQQLPVERAASWARVLIVGGEALWGRDLQFWYKNSPTTRIINEYGPTEAAVGCCVHEVSAKDAIPGAIPIGRPIANMRTFVLDKNLNPLPGSVPGELHLGGVGLARGYLNRPDLSAEQFIPDPFSKHGGERMYRTGDLAKYMADGNLEYLGRIDHQIKIRGFRVELGEVEAAIVEYPSVENAVVLAKQMTAGNHRLSAYVVAGPQTALDVRDLRRFLQQKLPPYMVPAEVLTLDEMPLTLHGKVDRLKLTNLDAPNPETVKNYISPRTGTEKTIAENWQEMIGLEKAGIHDNFFDLGGDSLLMYRSYHKLRVTIEKEFSIIDMFKYPTISSLARFLDGGIPENPESEQGEQRENDLEKGKDRLRRQLKIRTRASHRSEERIDG